MGLGCSGDPVEGDFVALGPGFGLKLGAMDPGPVGTRIGVLSPHHLRISLPWEIFLRGHSAEHLDFSASNYLLFCYFPLCNQIFPKLPLIRGLWSKKGFFQLFPTSQPYNQASLKFQAETTCMYMNLVVVSWNPIIRTYHYCDDHITNWQPVFHLTSLPNGNPCVCRCAARVIEG